MDPDVSSSPSPVTPVPAPLARRIATRGATFLALAALLAYIGLQARTLWREWNALQVEQANVRGAAVIGFYDISANPSFATKPADWYHEEGDDVLLWSGWEKNRGHRWFRVGRGDVERRRITLPIGRDVIRAVDRPIVEIGGGPIWERIPDDALVVGHGSAGSWTVYPIQLLGRVWVVNDQIDDHPCLVIYRPFARQENTVPLYDPVLEGRRLTMGQSGYLHDGQPLLYDRETESLWLEDEDTLRAIAGSRKGATLRLIGHLSPVSWSAWRSLHPQSRLLVGADRSQPRPSL